MSRTQVMQGPGRAGDAPGRPEKARIVLSSTPERLRLDAPPPGAGLIFGWGVIFALIVFPFGVPMCLNRDAILAHGALGWIAFGILGSSLASFGAPFLRSLAVARQKATLELTPEGGWFERTPGIPRRDFAVAELGVLLRGQIALGALPHIVIKVGDDERPILEGHGKDELQWVAREVRRWLVDRGFIR